jgi:lysozyme
MEMKMSQQGLDLIKHFEGIHDGDLTQIGLQPKLDPIGIVTIGYGRALKDKDGSWLKGSEGIKRVFDIYPQYSTITEEQALEFLDEDCDECEKDIDSLELQLKQQEFDALVSFTYNLGFGSLTRSNLLRKIKAGADPSIIELYFMAWNKAKVNGVLVSLPGLTRRRKSEAHLFNAGELKFEF